MVRSYILDSDALEGCLGAHGLRFCSGVVLGRACGDGGERDYALALVPTPPPAEGGNVPSAIDSLDATWVAEHARQCARMGAGATQVLGLFALHKVEGKGDVGAGKLFRILRETFARLKEDFGEVLLCDEFLILQIDNQSKRLVGRRCKPLDANSLSVVEVKAQPILQKAVPLVSFVPVSLLGTGDTDSVCVESLHRAAASALARLAGGLVRLEDPAARTTIDVHDGNATTQVAKLPSDVQRWQAIFWTDIAARKAVVLQGVRAISVESVVAARTLAFPRDTLRECLGSLAGDALRSALARVAAARDDNAAEDGGESAANITRPEPSVRWFAGLPCGGELVVSDYAEPDEEEADVRERIAEVFGCESSSLSNVASAEAFPPRSETLSSADAPNPIAEHEPNRASAPADDPRAPPQNAKQPSWIGVTAAAGAAALAAALAYINIGSS